MIKRLILDVLKPHQPGMTELSLDLLERLPIDGVTATLVEIDEDVRTIRVVLEGDELHLEEVERVFLDIGATIHSVDQVSCGTRIIRDQPVRQR